MVFRHLFYFLLQILTIVNCVVMNVGFQRAFLHCLWVPRVHSQEWYYWEVNFSFFIFLWGLFIWLSKKTGSVYIPASSEWEYIFSCIYANSIYSCSSLCKPVSMLWNEISMQFNLHLPNDQWCGAFFDGPFGHLYYFCGISFHLLPPFLMGICVGFLLLLLLSSTSVLYT